MNSDIAPSVIWEDEVCVCCGKPDGKFLVQAPAVCLAAVVFILLKLFIKNTPSGKTTLRTHYNGIITAFTSGLVSLICGLKPEDFCLFLY